MQGAFKFDKAFPDSNVVAVVPPSVDALKQRLLKRGTETEETLAVRLKNSGSELEQIFDFRDLFKYRVINNDLALASQTLSRLVTGLYASEIHGKPYLVPTGLSRHSSTVRCLGLGLSLFAAVNLIGFALWRKQRML